MKSDTENRPSLTRFARLSVAAAILTITPKVAAYLLTVSVDLFSDTLESVVNLMAFHGSMPF